MSRIRSKLRVKVWGEKAGKSTSRMVAPAVRMVVRAVAKAERIGGVEGVRKGVMPLRGMPRRRPRRAEALQDAR